MRVDYSAKEVIETIQDPPFYIQHLENSNNIKEVYDSVLDLQPYLNYFSEKEMSLLSKLFIENENIALACNEFVEVRAFFHQLFKMWKNKISEEQKEIIRSVYKSIIN